MYEGLPFQGLEFYKLLYKSDKFCAQLGRVVLAAGNLEAELIHYFEREEFKSNTKRATLGQLISIAKENSIDKNLIIALDMVCKQRNYLTHNIYSLFAGVIEETILEKHGLLDSDVDLYIERAWLLRENLEGLSKIVTKA